MSFLHAKPLLPGRFLLIGFILFWGGHAFSQSNDATNWFKLGLQEKKISAKIAAYNKAIEIDPLFVEALYNLGMAHKSQRQYPQAIEYLQRASVARPDKIAAETRVQIFYELSTTYRDSGEPEQAIEVLRTAEKIARDAKPRMIILFELGRLLAQESQLQEALSVLREGEEIAGNNRGQFSQQIRNIEARQQEVEQNQAAASVFAEAVREEAQGKLSAALALFNRVKTISPGYPNLAARIAGIEDKMRQQSEQVALQKLYEQAYKFEKEGSFELAASMYQDILAQNSGFKDAAQRLQRVRQQAEQQRIEALIEKEYQAGLLALRDKNWVRAIFSFEKVLEYDSNHREARARLREAQRGIDRESTATVLPRFYAEGLLLMKKGDFAAAITAFEKVRAMDAEYRDVNDRIAEAETKMSELVEANPTPPNNAMVDSLRQVALTAMKEQNWLQAVASLELLQTIVPDDQMTQEQLGSARAGLQKRDTNTTQAGPAGLLGNAFGIAGLVVAALLLPMSGVFVFSPAARARVQLLRGKYSAAAAIYERMIIRNPGKVKLYPALANIYMLTGRQDDSALKVYKTVLQLDLPVQDRERMHSLLAQQYVTGESNDGDAIDILEKELQKEVSRKKDDAEAGE